MRTRRARVGRATNALGDFQRAALNGRLVTLAAIANRRETSSFIPFTFPFYNCVILALGRSALKSGVGHLSYGQWNALGCNFVVEHLRAI